MPNYINNRFYLDPKKDFFDEFQEIIKMKKAKSPMIVLEDELVEGTKYYMQVEVNHTEGEDISSFWNYIFRSKKGCCHYIGIGTWGNLEEETYIRENFSVYREDSFSFSSQIEFLFKDNTDVFDYIVRESECLEGLDKWFNISLSKTENIDLPMFASSHCGAEMYINELTYEEVNRGLELLDHRNVFVRIQTQSSWDEFVKQSKAALDHQF